MKINGSGSSSSIWRGINGEGCIPNDKPTKPTSTKPPDVFEPAPPRPWDCTPNLPWGGKGSSGTSTPRPWDCTPDELPKKRLLEALRNALGWSR